MDSLSKEVTLIIISSIFLLLVAGGIIVLVLLYQKRQLISLREKESLKNDFEKVILENKLEIQEQTLKTISQEIHDNIGQTLSLAKLNLALEEEEQAGTNIKIVSSHQLVSKAIQDLRDISRSLNTDYVAEMGLIRSIEYELEMICKTGIMKPSLQVEGSQRRMDRQKELILFRIVQESLNNIIKHAGATTLTVAANYQPHELQIVIEDNGKGVDLSPLNENDNPGFGLGIRNMHNRARLIGAEFSMSSTIGRGTTVTIKLPVE